MLIAALLQLALCLRLVQSFSFPASIFKVHVNGARVERDCSTAIYARKGSSAPVVTTSTMTSNRAAGIKAAESGAILHFDGVSLSIWNNDIVNEISWSIMPHERWGLVGRNGAGKSTILKALVADDTVNVREGCIYLAKNARLGYLEQKGVSGSNASVREEVASRMERLQNAILRLNEAEKKVEAGDTSDQSLQQLENANIEFDAAGGNSVEQKIANVLQGLGFSDEDYDKTCSNFSGGWQMRIALARLLLSEPDVLVLDEPTNHLDKGAKQWLAQYLAEFSGTLLIVSHDEGVLHTAANSIAEVRSGRVELYKSRSYSQWQVEREERIRNAQLQYEANQREIERLQGFVDRFGAKTMGASMAQSRLKTIKKLEESGPEEPLLVGDSRMPVLQLPTPPRGSKELLKLQDCALSWDQSSSNDVGRVVIKDCNLVIERGMRIAVRGPNGAGKTTLMSALAGSLAPLSGQRIEGDGLSLGIFTQDLAQDLDQSARAVDVVTESVRTYDPTLTDERARSVLGALGLSGEKALRKVGNLSGGEKARVALASFVLIPHNLLLLDEPSNHLDVVTIKVLTKALREFEGSVLVISHDKEFLEEVQPTHVITVRDGEVKMEERDLKESDWDDSLIVQPSAASPTVTDHGSLTELSSEQNSHAIDQDMKKKASNARRRIGKIEKSLEKYEAEMSVIDEDMYANGRDRTKLQELQAEKDTLQSRIDKLYEEYEELMELI